MSSVTMKILVIPPIRGPKKAAVAKGPAGVVPGGSSTLGEMAMYVVVKTMSSEPASQSAPATPTEQEKTNQYPQRPQPSTIPSP